MKRFYTKVDILEREQLEKVFFWIPGGKRKISSYIFRCVPCRRLRGARQSQIMADLPADKLTPAPPFSYVGVDVFGPWSISTRKTRGGQSSNKR